MPETRILSFASPTHRHVPAHAPHRASWLIFAALVWSFLALAAPEAGQTVQAIKNTPLRFQPNPKAKARGTLPRGTIMVLTGTSQNGFVGVEVELEEGNATGWVSSSTVGRTPKKRKVAQEEEAAPPAVEPATDEEAEAPAAAKDSKRLVKDAYTGEMKEEEAEAEDDEGNLEVETIKVKRRPQVPKDEAVLLRREPTFTYGVNAGLHYGLLDIPQLNVSFAGPGFSIGGHVGYFIDQRVPVRLGAAFMTIGGSTETGSTTNPVVIGAGFNLLDLSAEISYIIDKLEPFVGIGYAMGIGINDLPTNVSLASANDASSLWASVGLGYRFPISEFATFIARGKYSLSFLRAPIAMSTFGAAFLLEIQG